MTRKRSFCLDSDVFIAAKNAYYAFAICPGFWKSLVYHHGKDRVFSIDQVRREILAGRESEDLVGWAKNELPNEFFKPTNSSDVLGAFGEVMLWAQRSTQYTEPAKAKFATEADGWLVAYARINNAIVVTNEQPRPDSKSRILLPDVCSHFKVAYYNTFAMLKDLEVCFEWNE